MVKKIKNQKLKKKSSHREHRVHRDGNRFDFCLLIFAFLLGLGGCTTVEFLTPDKPPYYRQLWQTYKRTNLKESTAADVMAAIRSSEYELLSQSKSVIASLGQKKKAYHTWFNIVAFDENEPTARRKYLLVINERPKILFAEPWEGVTYDSEMVLESDVLDKPYADENARRIAILRQVLENVRRDIDEVSPDNKMLGVSGMIINQALGTVLVKLDASPALAVKLSEPAGIEFSHVSFDKGKIRMVVEDDIVTIKMMLGSFVRYFEKRQENLQEEDTGIKEM